MSSSTTMRALMLHDYEGTPFRHVQLARPTPSAGQVLVKIHASGVNPIDHKIRTGAAPYAMPELPAVLGTDMAGVVEAVAPDATGFSVGDEVYGLTGGVRGLQGSLAEYAAVDAALIAAKPKSLSMRDAAGLPLVALTAWEGLRDRARVQPGQKVLVQAGAGGVGHVAVQLAKAFGAEVYATGSAEQLDLIRHLGATPIDYRTVSVEQYVETYTQGRGFDVIYDTVGGPTLDAAFGAIKHYGRIVSCAAFGPHNLAPSSLRSADMCGVFVLHPMLSGERRAHHGDILRQVSKLVEEGKLRPILDPRRFTLESAMEAHRAVEMGAKIKVVIDVQPNMP